MHFQNTCLDHLKQVCMTKVAIRSMCVYRICWGGCVDASLTQRGVRLTSCGWDVDVNADLRDAASLQRGHAGVRAKVSEFEVYDVQVGGPGRYVGVRLGDDHTLWAAQGTAIFQPAERQLFGRGRLHLGHSWHVMLHPHVARTCYVMHTCVFALPDKISWLHVQSGCCRHCGRGQEWSRIGPFSKLWRDDPFD